MVVSVSDKLSSAMRDILHVRPSHSVTVPNWIEPCDPPTPARIASAKSRFALDKPRNIALIGNIYEGKGQREFVEIALKLLEKRQDLCFLIAGVTEQNKQSRYLQDIRARIDGVGRSKDFRFIDWQSDLSEVFAVTYIAAVPSHNEAFGRVAAESMAAGVPVVASDTGGLREIVRDGDTGLLAKPGDIAGWAETIERLLDDTDLYSRVSRQGGRYARRVFRRDTVVTQIEVAYRTALRNRR